MPPFAFATAYPTLIFERTDSHFGFGKGLHLFRDFDTLLGWRHFPDVDRAGACLLPNWVDQYASFEAYEIVISVGLDE